MVIILGACISGAAPAAERGASVAPADRFDFAIPAQPLGTALIAFGSVTGVELIYDSALTATRQSSGLQGRFTTDEAISRILATSGLTARAVAPGAITIVTPAHPSAGLAPRPDSGRHAAFFARIQERFAEAFCHSQTSAVRTTRLLVRFTVNASGAMERLEMLGAIDEASRHDLMQVVSRVAFDVPPPKDLPQPVMMLILPLPEAC